MKNQFNNEWLRDYEEFVNGDGPAVVPAELKERVFKKVQTLVNPSPVLVFLKLMVIHLGVGFLSLSICHQFGINPFNTEYSLADWFMEVGGYYTCMIGCGVSFVSISLFAAGYFLTIEEVNALRRTEFLQSLVLGLISLGIFVVFGTELVLSVALLWLMGSLIGGLFASEAVWRLKRIG